MSAKKKGREIALDLYVNAMLSNAEIAEVTGVATRTLTKWIAEGGWKEMRAARAISPQETENDIAEILSSIAKERKESTSATERVRLADEAAKWNKVREDSRKSNRLSLGAHIQVLKDFMDFCNTRNPKATATLVDMQKQYITHKSAEYI